MVSVQLINHLCLFYQVYLVLQDENMLQLHNFYGRQVLGGLRLGTALVAGNEEQGGVHDGGPVQHGGHENVVT